MSPSDIYLSRSELRLLKSLKKDQKYRQDCNERDVIRLQAFGLCETLRYDNPVLGNPVIVAITGFGINYLEYKKSQTTHSFWNCIAWLIGSVIALASFFAALR